MWFIMTKPELKELMTALEQTSYTPAKNVGTRQKLHDKLDAALQEDKNPVLRAYRRRAKEQYKEGELEIDDDAVRPIEEGDVGLELHRALDDKATLGDVDVPDVGEDAQVVIGGPSGVASEFGDDFA